MSTSSSGEAASEEQAKDKDKDKDKNKDLDKDKTKSKTGLSHVDEQMISLLVVGQDSGYGSNGSLTPNALTL